MRGGSRAALWSGVEVAAGLIWLGIGSRLPLLAALPLLSVGAVFLASGISHLLWPGDLRVSRYASLFAVVGVVLAIPYGLVIGGVSLIGLLGAAAASGLAAGRMAIWLEEPTDGVPEVIPSPGLVAKVSVDEVVLGFEQFMMPRPRNDGSLVQLVDEMRTACDRFRQAGFLDDPSAYHARPPELVDPEIRTQEARGHRVEVLRFESGYAPANSEPGRERWLGYEPCRDAWAYVLRHPGRPRPWVICTNGYRMGRLKTDVAVFERLCTRNGLNVVIPVLPLHGPRSIGRHSGTGFLGLDAIDTVHALAQSVWDLRRLLHWTRTQEATAVAAFGLSLGGYTTAVFASIAEGLDCVIAGISLADLPRMILRHADSDRVRYAIRCGYDFGLMEETLRVVSPLALTPNVPKSQRLVFGANADRLVTPDHVHDLWRHWEEPEIVWYNGSHLSFIRESGVWAAVDRILVDSGVN